MFKDLAKKCVSVTKTEKYRIYKVLGIELKILRSSYRKMFKSQKEVSKRYQDLLVRLKNRREKKYRVGFMVGHIQKWKSQSVFDLMKVEDGLEPMVVIAPVFKEGESIECTINRMSEIQDYCRRKNMEFVVAWDEGLKDTIPLDSFNLDIVFYEQPWGIHQAHEIEQVSKKSLTYYVPYYVPNYGNLDYDCKAFHHLLFRYYVFNQAWKDLYLTRMAGYEKELCPVGHPMLDFYLQNPRKNNKQYVIFAPHHSFGSSSIGYGTFDWSGQAILEFAEKHPEFNWIFKPHPNTKGELVKNKIMNQEDVESYWKAWEKIGQVYEGGEYLPLFNDSSCLITDCGSFLVEYFYTGSPVIHLISGRAEKPVSAFKEIIDCYYPITTKEELLDKLNDLLVNKNDSMTEQRMNKLESLTQGQQSSSSKIVQDIKNTLGL